MKKLFFIFLIPLSLLAQNKDYRKRINSDLHRFLTQTEDIYYVKDIISRANKFGFDVFQRDWCKTKF